jgi:hypothetical protein
VVQEDSNYVTQYGRKDGWRTNILARPIAAQSGRQAANEVTKTDKDAAKEGDGG